MTESLVREKRPTETGLVATIRDAGVAGAGGAGFPTYSKWDRIDEVDALLVNHQESEPNYFIDKWLGREHATAFASLFEFLLKELLDVVVVSAKDKDRDHLRALERLTGGTVYTPGQLPVDQTTESGVVFAYTDDTYQYGMESVLLNVVADTVIGDGLPMDHGWLVQNTETLYNVFRAWTERAPVTRTYVHVGGNVPRHRFLDVPVGTPAQTVLDAAGFSEGELDSDTLLVSGGPGWCFPVDGAPDTVGVRKHTNCLMVLDSATADRHTLGSDRIDVLETADWTERAFETEPSERIEPETVHVPLVTNPEIGVVTPSEPTVTVGETVETGDRIAEPTGTGVSIPQHASVDGRVTAVGETTISIEAESATYE
ncbi:NADH dehydrogenase subunit [Halovenus halobia]|uniref:NADH dehydrogenase subunit n=1 Tax=Halovenus halobia TaxID=3396622 RepID=UPI003F54B38F